ncbi:alpha-galactosidase [Cohnella lubricantis]|uniref:Alpha-galactosidase n=1 Tax=Cohnella lubricantis TaxID=2163172 RepID=A0A841T7A0_9BACL|nr:alpha-galactosidase [Cohnella lubricantis]MBB6675815.1 alpha-galactosidase [Cohnella lubricantis]MBP2120650.1 alpha-galactosidase [Cohnella lubricantis]
MAIRYDESTRTFHLQSGNVSYVMQIVKGDYLAHLYWGRQIRGRAIDDMMPKAYRPSFNPNPFPEDETFSLDTLPQELPGYGTSDYRSPAYQVRLANGTTIAEFKVTGHRIMADKPALEGLPAVYAESGDEAETLEIELEDAAAGMKLIASYTVFRDSDAITRSVRIVNAGSEPVRVLRLLSASVDLPHSRFDAVHLWGTWARERHIARRALMPGVQAIESRRGASGHQHNPFFALVSPDATEDHGDVYAMNLVYSGSFLAQAEVDQFASTRLAIGLNPFDFEWLLEAGQSLQSPEAVLVYSPEGLGGMSRMFHKLYRTRLCRGSFRDKERPILINNWEATYFDFDSEKIMKIARAAKELGLELFVLDDGWFGKRNDDKRSLGDWFVNEEKLPGGLDGLAKRVNEQGLSFGLWVEPEMVSPDSDLYRAHPDWCLHVPDHRRTLARTQLILDFSRQDVRDYIAGRLTAILSSAPISYVKWDMNRNMTEIGSAQLPPERQRETAHRYMLGLYEVLEKITSAFPHILFESCSGGGGRFDAGMLYYMPQTWTSDDTDAIERLKIQYGTSLVYPISSMGSHVSAVPNHQVHRMTSLATRGHVAMSGNFGYELDLSKLADDERAEIARQVEEYKEIRGLVQQGDFYRLLSPFEGNETAWQFVSADKSEAYAIYVRTLAIPNGPLARLRLKGLDPNKNYKLYGTDRIYGGDELMYAGLPLPMLQGDFSSLAFRFVEA